MTVLVELDIAQPRWAVIPEFNWPDLTRAPALRPCTITLFSVSYPNLYMHGWSCDSSASIPVFRIAFSALHIHAV